MDDSKTIEIRRKLDDVRLSIGDEVQEIAESARTLSDWRYYVKRFPWHCLAGAAAVGYLAVPKRVEIVSPDADALEELAKRNKLVVQNDPQPRGKGGLVNKLVGSMAGAALRAVAAGVGRSISASMTAGGKQTITPQSLAAKK